MAWPPGEHIDALITLAYDILDNVRSVRHEMGASRAIIDLEGDRGNYRIIISEIHRSERACRYAYYVLDRHHRIVHAFDNSPDNLAVKECCGKQWKAHLHEELPHQHDAEGMLSLRAEPMNFNAFIEWMQDNIFSSNE